MVGNRICCRQLGGAETDVYSEDAARAIVGYISLPCCVPQPARAVAAQALSFADIARVAQDVVAQRVPAKQADPAKKTKRGSSRHGWLDPRNWNRYDAFL